MSTRVLTTAAGVASMAVLLAGLAGPVTGSGPPADLKGYALQQYQMQQLLNRNKATPPRPSADAPAVPPRRSTLRVVILPGRPAEAVNVAVFGPAKVTAPADVAAVMGHLPPGADMWIQDVPVIADVNKPVYEVTFPTLEKGVVYHFTVRARWVEDGKWVTQTHTFPLRAGEVHCVQVVANDAPEVEKAVATSLAGLPPAGKAAAEAQKFCAVQRTIRLGSMGTPVKVELRGKDVYLCCEGCRTAALKNPDETLKAVAAPHASR